MKTSEVKALLAKYDLHPEDVGKSHPKKDVREARVSVWLEMYESGLDCQDIADFFEMDIKRIEIPLKKLVNMKSRKATLQPETARAAYDACCIERSKPNLSRLAASFGVSKDQFAAAIAKADAAKVAEIRKGGVV